MVAQDVQDLAMRSEIKAEQVGLIYKQGPLFWVGAAATACVIALFGYSNDSGHQHLWWLVVVMIGAAVRLWLLFLYNRRDPSVVADVKVKDWGRRFALSSTLSGLLWGSWPFWFYSSANTDFLMMITALIAAMVAVLANSGSVYLPAFVCFALPLCLTSVLFLVLSEVEMLVWTGWLLCLFFFVNLALALRNNHQHRELLVARYRNNQLLGQLDKKKRVAEKAVLQKNRFITTASHDLRQPLHALTLLIAALGRSPLSSKQRSILDDVRKSNRALNEHFNVILDLSRLESDSIDVLEQRFSLVNVLNALVGEFQSEARAKDLQLRLELRVVDAVFVTDRILLERILRNLLSNAIKFTQHGEIVVSLIDMPCGGFELHVQDSGEGIAQDDIAHIFDEYRRVSSTGSGLGLGLSIVHHLCRLLTIRVSVDSTLGQGTCFTLSVPQTLVASTQPEENKQPAFADNGHAKQQQGVESDQLQTEIVATDLSNPSVEFDDLRVLVIDDDEDILTACQHLFESYAATVMLAKNARVAVDWLAGTGTTKPMPDVILCDYHLSEDITAFDTIARVRERCGHDVPVCIISGDTSAQVVSDVTAAGFPLLLKPMDEDALVACIASLTNTLSESPDESPDHSPSDSLNDSPGDIAGISNQIRQPDTSVANQSLSGFS